jgi:zinc protease
MNFKGTTNIPRDQVKGIIEQFGGSWNGYTWIDQTAYLETATCDALDRMLFIESERMANCLYEPDDCESERTVIISELQGGENDPDQLLDQELTATAFKAHTYRHPTIGWLSDLETMTRDDLYRYYRRYYVPNNATLVIVGDVDAADVMQRVDRYFRGIQPGGGEIPRIKTIEPEQTGERRVTIRKAGTARYLKIGYHAPAANDTDFIPLLVLDAVLTGAKGLNLWSSFRVPPPQRSARLYRALVERGLASYLSGSLVPTEQPFLYTLSATATEGTSLDVVESAMLEELELVRNGVTEAELRKAKAQLRARLVFDSDSVTNIAHQLGYFETIGSLGVFTSAAASIDAVTGGDVAAAAARVLRTSNRTIGWFDAVSNEVRKFEGESLKSEDAELSSKRM